MNSPRSDLQHKFRCGPCKILGPKLERVVDASQGQVDLAIVDVDESQEVAEKLSVSSIPAVFAFHKGKIVGSFIGNQDQAQVKNKSNINLFFFSWKSL